jgi:hypothetical protein
LKTTHCERKKSTKDANILILIDDALIQDLTLAKIERKPYRRSPKLILIYIFIAITFSSLPLPNTDSKITDLGLHQADLIQVDLHQANLQQELYYTKHSNRNTEIKPPRLSSNIEITSKLDTKIYRKSLHRTQGIAETYKGRRNTSRSRNRHNQRAAGTSERASNEKGDLHVGEKNESTEK